MPGVALAGEAVSFLREFRLSDAPEEVCHHAKRCLIDLLGVAAAGSQLPVSHITRRFALTQFGAGEAPARLLFDGRGVSQVGAALANGTSIDAFDAHDGHPLTKGHAGCGSLAGLLAFSGADTTGEEFLAHLIAGYEISIRAGLSLHSSAADYHTSGAWVALGVAGIGGRVMGFDRTTMRHALGIAEYHGPRSQMMRCIDYPTMVKDGSGPALSDAGLLALAEAIELIDDPAFSMKFPKERWAQVDLHMADGRTVSSDAMEAHGNTDTPLSDDALFAKFSALMAGAGLDDRAADICDMVMAIEQLGKIDPLLEAIYAPAK